MKCENCKVNYDDWVELHPLFLSSKGYTALICGICALEQSDSSLSSNNYNNMTRKPAELEMLAISIVKSRKEFHENIMEALKLTESFALNVSKAIGEISIEEAREAIITFFTEKMKKEWVKL